MARSGLLAAAVAVVFGVSAGNAAAATITVTTTTDETTANGQCSLREALQAADAPGSADGDCAPAAFGANTIVLGPHSYTLTGPGELEVTDNVRDLTIRGAGVGRTAIDASRLGDRVFLIDAQATATIRDLTITGGHARDGAAGAFSNMPQVDGGQGGDGAGGGAIANLGSLTLLDSAITNSVAGSGGGGGYS